MNQSLQLELEARGAAVVREFLPYDVAVELRQSVVECCERLERGAQQHLMPPYTDWQGWNGTRLDHLLPWSETLRTVTEQVSQWGVGSQLRPECCIVRRAAISKGMVGWHCDAEAASMLQYGGNCFTVWLPLDPVGVELPSVEFVLGSHKLMRNRTDLRIPGHPGRDVHRSEAFVAEFTGEHYIPLINELGTAAVFDQYTLHRTQQLLTDRPRLSTEFRFTRG